MKNESGELGEWGRHPVKQRRVIWKMEFGNPLNDVTERILACAFDVHARMGPGLLESSYGACLRHRLAQAQLHFEREVPIKIDFDGLTIETAYRADLIVEGKILIELKAIERLLPVHISQTLSYMKHANLESALLLNFNVKSLRDGIRRFDNRHLPSGPTPLTPPTRSSRF